MITIQILTLGILLAPVLVATAAVLIATRRAGRERGGALVIALAAASIPVAAVLHNVLSALIRGEEAVSFIAALVVAPAVFAVAAIYVGVGLARDGRRWEIGASVAISGAGMALFIAYMAFAILVTTLEGRNPPYQAAVEAIVFPTAALAVIGGAVSALFCALVPRRQALV